MNTFQESCCFIFGVFLFFCLRGSCADSKPEIVHKAVGSSLHLTPDHPKQTLSLVEWKLNGTTFAEYKNDSIIQIFNKNSRFAERIESNQSDISVTVKNLVLLDSGIFTIVSEGQSEQYDTKVINLRVHDPIMDVQIQHNVTWLQSKNMCTFHLWCLVSGHLCRSCKWSGHKERNEPELYFNLTSAENATLTCTANNSVSTRDHTVTVLCIKEHESSVSFDIAGFLQKYLLLIAVPVGIVGIAMIIGIIGVCWWRKQKGNMKSEAGITVYEDVNAESVVKTKKRSESVINGMSIYETVDDMKVSSNTPQTLYDKISYQRPPATSTSSPYQHVL